MKKLILCALIAWAGGLFASVSVKTLPNDAKNVEYYNDNPVVMKRIMDSVNVRFTNIQQKIKE